MHDINSLQIFYAGDVPTCCLPKSDYQLGSDGVLLAYVVKKWLSLQVSALIGILGWNRDVISACQNKR